MEQKRMQAKTGEIAAIFPERGFSLIRTFENEQFYAKFSAYVTSNQREIQKGVIVKFQTTGKTSPEQKFAPALLIEIDRGQA